MKTLEQLIEDYKVSMTVAKIDQRPDGLMDDMPTGSRHYRCVIRRGRGRMTVNWSQGPAIVSQPTVADVLACVVDDTRDIDQPFDSWAGDIGFNPDSRKAERIFRACQRQGRALARLFSADEVELMQEAAMDR